MSLPGRKPCGFLRALKRNNRRRVVRSHRGRLRASTVPPARRPQIVERAGGRPFRGLLHRKLIARTRRCRCTPDLPRDTRFFTRQEPYKTAYPRRCFPTARAGEARKGAGTYFHVSADEGVDRRPGLYMPQAGAAVRGPAKHTSRATPRQLRADCRVPRIPQGRSANLAANKLTRVPPPGSRKIIPAAEFSEIQNTSSAGRRVPRRGSANRPEVLQRRCWRYFRPDQPHRSLRFLNAPSAYKRWTFSPASGEVGDERLRDTVQQGGASKMLCERHSSAWR